MKRLLVLVLLSAFVLSASAQRVEDSLRYAESVWSMKKKAMILEQMDLTEAEKSSFWPVYDSYANAIQFLDMEYIRLMNYISEDELKEKQLESVCEHMLENDLLLAKTRKQYYQRFKKALSPAQAGKFMQLDSDFRTLLRIEMQRQSPAYVTRQDKVFSQN
jgi:Spy/CpxP family protein refolding chaperone